MTKICKDYNTLKGSIRCKINGNLVDYVDPIIQAMADSIINDPELLIALMAYIARRRSKISLKLPPVPDCVRILD